MALPSSGAISMANIRSIIQPGGGAIDLNNSNSRFLAKGNSNPGQISLNQFYNKPASGSITYNTSGYATDTTYTFIIPAYQNLTATAAGAGGGGGGGDNHNSYGAGNSGYGGGNGNPSQFTYSGFVANAYGGAGGAGNGGGGTAAAGGEDATGNFGTFVTGGGASGGAGGAPQQGGVWGGNGGPGGYVSSTFTFGSTSYYPSYGSTISLYFGSGGAAAPQNASSGSPGYVSISYS